MRCTVERIAARPPIAAGLAAAVASVGVIAAGPTTVPNLQLPQFDVQLTYAPADVFGILADNLNVALGELEGVLDSLGAFDLDGALAGVFDGINNFIFMPENLLIAGVGVLTGDGSVPFFDTGHYWTYDSDIFETLANYMVSIGGFLQNSFDDLLSLNIAGSVWEFLNAFNLAVFAIPEEILVGTTAFLWSDLLGLP